MIANDVVTGVIVIILGYLLGSFPSAYILTSLATGKDIRQLGGGNAGARNVVREVGIKTAIPVAIFDVGKGVAAMTLAHRLLNISINTDHSPCIHYPTTFS